MGVVLLCLPRLVLFLNTHNKEGFIIEGLKPKVLKKSSCKVFLHECIIFCFAYAGFWFYNNLEIYKAVDKNFKYDSNPRPTENKPVWNNFAVMNNYIFIYVGFQYHNNRRKKKVERSRNIWIR